jgi:peptidoglycan/LPS O-acetylase OafA/YrhL
MRRLTCLDGLRGLLALYVMLGHTLPFAAVPRWIAFPFAHGGAAVDVFFILSGLVIVQSLGSYRYRRMPFLIARVARIYPVFLIVFGAALLVLSLPVPAMPWIAPDSQAFVVWPQGWPRDWPFGIASHLTMTHGLFPDGIEPDVWIGFLGAAWSLSTEWQFYLLAALIAARVSCGGKALLQLAWLFLALSALSLVWSAHAPDAWQFSRAFLPNKAQYFGLGIASAALVRQEPSARRGCLAILVAACAAALLQGGAGKLVAPLVWSCCLAAQLRPDWQPLAWLAALLSSRTAVWLGAVSYCLYLVNEPVHKLLIGGIAALANGDALLFDVLWLPAATLLPLLAAWWLHVAVEAPALRWGRDAARSLALNVGRNRAAGSAG